MQTTCQCGTAAACKGETMTMVSTISVAKCAVACTVQLNNSACGACTTVHAKSQATLTSKCRTWR